MRNRLLTLLLVGSSVFSMLFASKKVEVIRLKNDHSIESIMMNMEATYNHNMPRTKVHRFRDADYAKTERSLLVYMEELAYTCDMSAIEEYVYEMIVESSHVEYGEEDLIRYASIYLMCKWKTYADVAYQALATAYANLNDKDNLRFVLYNFEHSDINKDGDYDAVIAQMRNDMDAILHPKNMASNIQGVWVSDKSTDRRRYGAYPYSIIDIHGLTDDGFYSLTLPSLDNSMIYTTFSSTNDLSTFRMAQIVEFDNPTDSTQGRISAQFSSQHFQRGINTSSGFEQVRQFQSNMRGNIAASNMSFGDQIGATVATTAVSALMNYALLQMAQSSQTIATMTIDLHPNTEDIMTGNMVHYHHTFKTNNPNEEIEPTYEGNVNYLRWLPEDSVFFVDNHGKVFSVTPIEDLDLTEYKKIKLKEDVKKGFIYGSFAVAIAGLYGGGLAVIFAGKPSSGKLWGGLMMSLVGAPLVTIPLVLYATSPNTDAFKDINRKQLKKLREKRGASISISPTIDPFNGGGGFLLDVKY